MRPPKFRVRMMIVVVTIIAGLRRGLGGVTRPSTTVCRRAYPSPVRIS